MIDYIANLFGSKKGLSNAVSTGTKMLDNAFHTSQEVTEDNIDMVKSLQDQYSPRSITRRILAVLVFGNYFLHLNFLIAINYFHPEFDMEPTLSIVASETKIVLMVSFFYFGYYSLKKVLPKKK